MAVSNDGDFVVTGSHDRSIRIWQRTEEPLFLEEERDNAMDAMFEAPLVEDMRTHQSDQLGTEVVAATTRTLETVKGSEKILEALEHAEDPTTPIAQAMLRGRKMSEYVYAAVSSVAPSDLEEALLLLPYASLFHLLGFIEDWLSSTGTSVEVACRCLFFLLAAHQNHISVDRKVVELLTRLNKKTKEVLQKQKDLIGYNRSALAHMRRELEVTTNGSLFKIEEIKKVQQLEKKKLRELVKHKKEQKR